MIQSILLFVLQIIYNTCNPIKVETTQYKYRAYLGAESEIEVIECRITNCDTLPCYSWVYPDSVRLSLNDERRAILHYFFKPSGDVNNIQLMGDNCTGSLTEKEIIIGATFIKKVNPGESFTYIIFRDTAQAISKCLLDDIVIYSYDQLSEFGFLDIIESPSIKDIFYNRESIVLMQL